MPGQALPGRAVRLVHPSEDADAIARSLRIDGERAVYGRIEQGAVLLELRTVLPEHDKDLVETVRRVMAPYRPTAP